MAKLNRLTAAQVRGLKKPGAYSDGNGLYLQVRGTGDSQSKSWIFRYMRHRVSHNMGLGSIRVVGLAEARLLAADAQRQLHDGMDPLDQKRRGTIARNSPTFKVASLRYIDIHKPSWKSPKHIAQWSNSLKAYAWPVLGSITVDLASREHIVQILEPIWLTKPETASRIRGRMEKIFDWAEAEGYRTGDNPARWKGNLDHSLPKRTGKRRTQHLAAMPYGEVPGFYARLPNQGGMAAVALRFLILTAARTNEVRFATREELNLADSLWVVPGARMKAGKEHRVPLAPEAVEILEQVAGDGRFLFSPFPDKAMSENGMLSLLKRMKVQNTTVHGFRSAFRDWAADNTSAQREVIETSLAHTNPDQVEAAYLRSEMLPKRVALMYDWALFVTNGSHD